MSWNRNTFTSHFVWISLDSKPFWELFVDLQNYVHSNNIENIISLVNPLSLHITLCYYPAQISPLERQAILEDVSILNKKISSIVLDEVSYFWAEWSETHMYIWIKDIQWQLKDVNEFLKKKYSVCNVLDNTYSYIPHITLLKISDSKVFWEHKSNIEKIINEHMANIMWSEIFTEVWLYAVNSRYIPELQFLIKA